jgi:hypothetical protein
MWTIRRDLTENGQEAPEIRKPGYGRHPKNSPAIRERPEEKDREMKKTAENRLPE